VHFHLVVVGGLVRHQRGHLEVKYNNTNIITQNKITSKFCHRKSQQIAENHTK
jgi:hypothetical protein